MGWQGADVEGLLKKHTRNEFQVWAYPVPFVENFLMIHHALPNKVQPTNDNLDGISNIWPSNLLLQKTKVLSLANKNVARRSYIKRHSC